MNNEVASACGCKMAKHPQLSFFLCLVKKYAADQFVAVLQVEDGSTVSYTDDLFVFFFRPITHPCLLLQLLILLYKALCFIRKCLLYSASNLGKSS